MAVASQTFDTLQALFIERGERFLAQALKSRSRIADLGHDFIQDGMVTNEGKNHHGCMMMVAGGDLGLTIVLIGRVHSFHLMVMVLATAATGGADPWTVTGGSGCATEGCSIQELQCARYGGATRRVR